MQSDKLFERYRALQQYVGWTDEDTANVVRIAPLAREHFRELIEDFYAAIQQSAATMKVITGGAAQIGRLKGTLVKWLEELFSGHYEAEYVVRRWKVGHRHVEIGLDQVYTNAALSRLRNGLLKLLTEKDMSGDLKQVLSARISLNKLLDLDLAIIEDAYQSEMQRRQQQVERLATIGQVAGGIAHELRNPLNVIKTSVYYLRNSTNLSQEKLTSHLERIDRQASVADNVIGALNSFARLPLPEMQPTRLDECLREVLELIGLPEGIQLTLDLPPTLPPALADRQQLSIVFGNLIRNARDAMPDGGALSIRGRHKAGFIEIDVEDSGMGIHPDNLAKIMEPLFSTKARGIGLGLPIARAIVEKHRGRLTVASQPCRGTKFTVELLAASDGLSGR
jgi:signal transduction histidine kinase